jgi:fructose-1,6-bisphosphatase/sedoheptulose 1,7-bisphosphatase-like protein
MTHSVVIRSRTGTIRWIEAIHRAGKLSRISDSVEPLEG